MTDSRPFDPKKPKPEDPAPPDHLAGDTWPAGGDADDWCAWRALTDIGNGERLRRRYGGDLLFVRGVGWHGWDGARWSREEGEDIAHLAAQRTVKAIKGEAARIDRPEYADKVKAHGARSGSSGAVANMQREARPHLTRPLDHLDARPALWTVANGTLELGDPPRLRPHAQGDLITRASPVPYDPDADSPVFLAFINEVLPDPQVRDFVQRWFGYCATGHISEQVFCLFHGSGSNGKSTLVDIVRHVFGDYSELLPMASLLEDNRRRGGEPTPDIARLPGARLVTASEPELDAKFSDAQVKSLIGDGVIAARNLREGFFNFLPQFKLTVSCNNKPNVRGQDYGIWRRILLVPWTVTFSQDEIDRELPAKLLAEAPGVLNWIVEGARQWFAGGLAVPDQVRAATRVYRREADAIGRFLDECTVRGSAAAGLSVNASYLYQAYRDWCADAAEQAFSQTLFGKRLRARGIDKTKIGTYVYLDMTLTDDAKEMVARCGGGGDGGDDDRL